MTDESSTTVKDGFLEQRRSLAAGMDHWLDLFDSLLAAQQYRPSNRPIQALMMMFSEGVLEAKAGDTVISGDDGMVGKMEETWFRVMYDAVEYWYLERYGEAVMQENGNDELVGAVSIRGVLRKVAVPLHRRKVEVEAEQSWIYFEDGLGEGEDAASMIVDAPDLGKLDEDSRNAVISEATLAAEVLRRINFRTVTFRSNGDQEVRKLIQSTSTYLQQAAVRMVSFRDSDRGLAWFDLQMANETAMKSIGLLKTGKQPWGHHLDELVADAVVNGVDVDQSIFDSWPRFSDISEWRYGKGHPPSFADLYLAYQLTLKLAQACMGQYIPEIKSGFRVLVKYAPWKIKNAVGEFRE